MRPTNCCYECEKRYVGCHSNCDKYLAFKRSRDQINEAKKNDTSFLTTAPKPKTKRMARTCILKTHKKW